MKKLVFLFAMVLIAGFVMAQKTTTLVQSGNSNIATVDQMACLSGAVNSIFATQSGNWNTLTTFQKGWDNNIDLLQSGDHNTADMTQETCDFGTSHGYNTAKVVQYGDANKADLSQMETDGDGGDAWILGYPVVLEMDRSINLANATQSGNSNSYTLKQGRDEYIPDNTSYLVQSGNSNNADVDQLGFNNYSEIRQTGDWNTADLLQDGADISLSAVNTDKSYSWQTGVHSTLNVKQVGDVDEQLAESVQNGSANTTNILQVGKTVQNVNAWQYGTDVIDVDQVDVEP